MRRRGNRPGLSLRLLATRRPARRFRRSFIALARDEPAGRDSHARGGRGHVFAADRPRARVSGAVFHCFTGGDRARARALDLGFHLSLAGIVTFPKATDLHDVAAFVPEDRLLDRDRQPVSGARAAPREAERAGVGGLTSPTRLATLRRISASGGGRTDDPERPATLRRTSSCAR